MKISKINMAVAAVVAAGLVAGCGKRTPNTPPEPDTETHSAIEAAWATYVMTDIDMICGYAGVNELLDMPYTHIETQDNTINKMVAVRNTSEERLSVVFNRTKSRDGRFRDGEIRLIYNSNNNLNPYANANSNYIHEFGFGGLLNINNYKVDSFLISIPHPGHGFIINRLPETNDKIDPKTTPLKWEILTKLHIQHHTDTTGAKDIWIDVALFKVLENSADTAVYNPSRPIEQINWDKAIVGYYGKVIGTIGGAYDGKNRPTGGLDWTMDIKESQKLIRDFTCVPDRARGVVIDANDDLTQLNETHHPFVKGVATFKPGDKYPRQIYFGNESNTNLGWQCDNTGEVMIKGIAYRVNFRK